MKIKLLDKYEAEVSDLFPQLAVLPWRQHDSINVQLTFDEAVSSCLSFGVEIAAKDYTEEEFLAIVRVEAEAALTNIIKKAIENREESRKRDESRKALNKLTADLGDKLGIPYILSTR